MFDAISNNCCQSMNRTNNSCISQTTTGPMLIILELEHIKGARTMSKFFITKAAMISNAGAMAAEIILQLISVKHQKKEEKAKKASFSRKIVIVDDRSKSQSYHIVIYSSSNTLFSQDGAISSIKDSNW